MILTREHDWRIPVEEHRSGLLVPAGSLEEPRLPTSVDLFAGAGGFSCGMHQAGFHTVAAADGNHAAALTYLCNLGAPTTLVHVLPPVDGQPKRERAWNEHHEGETMNAVEFFDSIRRGPAESDSGPGAGWISSTRTHERGSCADHIDDPDKKLWFCDTYHATPPHREPCLHYFLGDVRELTGKRILDALDMQPDDLDCVVGGPPCQGFSKANNKRSVMDPRNSLVFDFARLITELQPKTMVMENVPAMAEMITPEGLPVIDAFCQILEDGEFAGFEAMRRSLLGRDGARAAQKGSRSPGAQRDAHKATGRGEMEAPLFEGLEFEDDV